VVEAVEKLLVGDVAGDADVGADGLKGVGARQDGERAGFVGLAEDLREDVALAAQLRKDLAELLLDDVEPLLDGDGDDFFRLLVSLLLVRDLRH
jgi:hypothetical protein